MLKCDVVNCANQSVFSDSQVVQFNPDFVISSLNVSDALLVFRAMYM